MNDTDPPVTRWRVLRMMDKAVDVFCQPAPVKKPTPPDAVIKGHGVVIMGAPADKDNDQ